MFHISRDVKPLQCKQLTDSEHSITIYHLSELCARYGLVILDLTVAPSGALLENAIRSSMDFAHQSRNNVVLVIYPQVYSGLSVSVLLKEQRHIEDRLMAHSADLDIEISIHYIVDNMHGSEKRHLASRARLVTSTKVGSSSPWKDSEAARGKIANVTPPLAESVVNIQEKPMVCIKTKPENKSRQNERNPNHSSV